MVTPQAEEEMREEVISSPYKRRKASRHPKKKMRTSGCTNSLPVGSTKMAGQVHHSFLKDTQA